MELKTGGKNGKMYIYLNHDCLLEEDREEKAAAMTTADTSEGRLQRTAKK